MGTSARRGWLRAACGAMTVLVAVAMLVVVGGTHRPVVRTSVTTATGSPTVGATVRGVDHVVAAPLHAPVLDPVAIADELVVPAPRGSRAVLSDCPPSLDRVSPAPAGRGPPTS